MRLQRFPIRSLIALVLACSKISWISAQSPLPYDVVYSWKKIDFQFKSPEHKTEAIKSGEYIPEIATASGIKVSGDRIFITVARWRAGAPASLAYVPYNRTMGPQPMKEPLLIPYPSWEFNEGGNCAVLQYAQSMEIDQFSRMWVIDAGRRNIFDKSPDNKCPPKLLLLDLKTDQVIHSHEFPAEVVGRTSNFLNDLVVGCTSEKNCMVYISDSVDAKIIAFDFSTDKSWFVQHPSMKADPDALKFTILGTNYTFDIAVNGIALSNKDRNFDTVYYCSLSGVDVYSVAVATIKQAGASKQPGVQLKDSDVTHIGKKDSQSDGMTIDANGIMYYGDIGHNAIKSWNTNEGKMTDANQKIVAQNDNDLQWVDTFSIDTDGHMFVTPSRLHRHFTDTLDFSDTNFRVVRFFINSENYMYSKMDPLT
ncbi:unnamed protein product [Allacma fusca]|uniref:Uncharacterized protein n=1 Tax=Allacma fusca TaxID=39272 RepID=A0A8J2J5S9_9HEXA|nr:unnamed protein product [Allacma fusca]